MAEQIQFSITSIGTQAVVNDLQKVFAAISATNTKFQDLSRQLDLLKSKSASNAGARDTLVTQLTGDPTKSKEALKQVQSELRATETELNRLARAAKDFKFVPNSQGLTRHQKEIEKLTAQYLNLTVKARETPKGQTLLAKLKVESEALKKALNEVNKALGKTEQSSSGLGAFANLFANVARFTIASTAIGYVTQAFTDSISTVIEFEAEIVNLGALLGGDKARLGDLSAQAEVLGRTTAFTATEVAKLQQELVKLGLKPDAILASTSAIVDFSVAVRESADRVALLTGSTIKAFNLTAIETRRVVDSLTRSTINTALSFSYLETALPTVSAAAATAGVGLEELLAVLGVLADRGVPASTAATSFRNILIESSKAGLDYKDSLELLNNSQSKLATAFDLFGKRGAVQALILAKNLKEVVTQQKELETGSDRFGKALASASQIAVEQLSSLQGRITLLKSAWSGLAIAIGNTELGKAVVNQTAGALNGITALIEGTASLGEFLSKTAAFGGNFVAALTSISNRTIGISEVEKAVSESLQEQARTRQGIFREGIKTSADQLIQDTERLLLQKKLTSAYKSGGLTEVEARSKAITFVYKQTASLRELRNVQNQLQVNEELDLLQFGNSDIEAVKTLNSATQLVEAFKEAVERADQTTPRFKTLLALLNAAEKKEAELAANIKANTTGFTKGKTEIETLTESLKNFEKRLESTNDVTKREVILENIANVQAQLDAKKKLYNDFLKGINLLTVQRSSEDVKKNVLAILKADLEAQAAAQEIKARNTITSEAQLAKQIELINVEKDRKLLQGQLDTLQQTDDNFAETLAKLRAKGAEGIKIRLELETIKFEDSVDTDTAKKNLEAAQNLTSELEYQGIVEKNNLEASTRKLEFQIKSLEAQKLLGGLALALGNSNVVFTQEQEKQLAIAKETLIIDGQKLIALQAAAALKSGSVINEAEITSLKEIIALQEQFKNGKFTGQERDLLTARLGRTPEEYLQWLIDISVATKELKIAEEELRQAQLVVAVQAVTGSVSDEAYKRALEAQANYNQASQNLTDKNNSDTSKAQAEADRKLLQERRKLNDAVVDAVADFGGELADALIGEEGASVKDALKKLVLSLLDILAQYYIAKQSILLAAAVADPKLLFTVPSILRSIALIKIGSTVAKALIKSFEKGGQLGTTQADRSGGRVTGKRHAQGGVKYRYNDEIIELEDGETIINRKSSHIFKNELSRINSYNGYGRKFGDGGVLASTPQVLQPKFEVSGIDEGSYLRQAQLIAREVGSAQIDVILKQNEILVTALTTSLNTTQRLKERLDIAQKQSTI